MHRNTNDTEITEDFLRFTEASPTAYQTVEEVIKLLEAEDWKELDEADSWALFAGGKYYVTRNGSSIICFSIGDTGVHYNFQIGAAHTDSPAFKIKENAEIHVSDTYTKLNTEGYGGMICNTWLDRPLSVAGRIITAENGQLKARSLKVDRDLLVIPNVCIHMNRKINEGIELNRQVDLLPLFGEGTDEGSFLQLIAREAGVPRESILGTDLYLYSRVKPSIWGCSGEFFSGPHLDDLQSLYPMLRAILSAKPVAGVKVAAFFDNEEVGSTTKQGAASTFLGDTLLRISLALGKSQEEHIRALSSSFMVSADNAHAVHPNHPELTDPTNHVYMNRGVVVKMHANQKYTSDGLTIATIREIARRAGVPVQFFANRSDKNGGSTLGNIALTHVSIPCVDIGLAQLAMHSSYETAGTRDLNYMVRLLKEFYEVSICRQGDGCMRVEHAGGSL